MEILAIHMLAMQILEKDLWAPPWRRTCGPAAAPSPAMQLRPARMVVAGDEDLGDSHVGDADIGEADGWQTRWFVLDSLSGVLSYYKSEEEASQGCKGSVKVSVCQINVSSVDMTRMDLVIPGQQHMYLRAPSPQERQKWLVALGSTKACVDMKIGDPQFAYDDPNSIHHKKSELKLYCDLLMQQVHALKSAAKAEDGPEITMMDEASSLLSATCDTFIKTLEEIMKVSSASTGNVMPYDSSAPIGTLQKNGVAHSAKIQSQSVTIKMSRPNLIRSQSQENR